MIKMSIHYPNSTGLTGAPSLYTVANENMNEKNPDIQMVVADTHDRKDRLIFICLFFL